MTAKWATKKWTLQTNLAQPLWAGLTAGLPRGWLRLAQSSIIIQFFPLLKLPPVSFPSQVLLINKDFIPKSISVSASRNLSHHTNILACLILKGSLEPHWAVTEHFSLVFTLL